VQLDEDKLEDVAFMMEQSLVPLRALDLRALHHSETCCGSRGSCEVREVRGGVFNRRAM
jgi:hypothetical protein